ncbi:hypothetical protein CYMTET_34738, partial [Cymbomonas tetramitiformis]
DKYTEGDIFAPSRAGTAAADAAGFQGPANSSGLPEVLVVAPGDGINYGPELPPPTGTTAGPKGGMAGEGSDDGQAALELPGTVSSAALVDTESIALPADKEAEEAAAMEEAKSKAEAAERVAAAAAKEAETRERLKALALPLPAPSTP